jgi:hypothetical protein
MYQLTLNIKCLIIIMIIITTQYAGETGEYLRVKIITRFQGYQQPKILLKAQESSVYTSVSTSNFRRDST